MVGQQDALARLGRPRDPLPVADARDHARDDEHREHEAGDGHHDGKEAHRSRMPTMRRR
jgi:hypothetical protein